jgi:hypothetical protein
MEHASAFLDLRATVAAHVRLLRLDGYVEISVEEKGIAQGMGGVAACREIVYATQVGQD